MYEDNYEAHIPAILDSPTAPRILDRLKDAFEAERQRRQAFYRDVDDDVKAEFINGEVIIHSLVKKEHTDVVGFLYKILDTFVRLSQMGYVGYEKVMSAFERNDYEPDIVYFNPEKAQHFKKGQWKYPVPDFAVEVVSESTEQRDRGIKFKDYAAHGIKEYWIINPVEETVEQYLLRDDRYHLILKTGSGMIESAVVQNFKIDIRAMFDEKTNLEVLKKILLGEYKHHLTSIFSNG